MPDRVQGVLFDFGGTLARQQAPQVIQRILTEEGTPCALDVLDRAIMTAAEQDALTATRSEFRGYTRPGDENEYVRFNRMILQHAGIPDQEGRIARLIDERWTEYASLVGREAFEDVLPCLERMREMNLKMGVVSNIDSTEVLHKGLMDIKIAEYFSVLTASGSVGYVKPHPEIFRIASRELQIPTEKLVHVGDLYAVDVVGAANAGVTGVLLDRENSLPQIDCHRISSLEELPSTIERL